MSQLALPEGNVLQQPGRKVGVGWRHGGQDEVARLSQMRVEREYKIIRNNNNYFFLSNNNSKEKCKVSLCLLVVSQRVDALSQDEQ